MDAFIYILNLSAFGYLAMLYISYQDFYRLHVKKWGNRLAHLEKTNSEEDK